MKKETIIKYVLFVCMLVLVILVVQKKNKRLILDVRYRDEPPTGNVLVYDVVLHVATEHDLIIPLHVTVKHDQTYLLNGYEEIVMNEESQRVYYAFSLLTNLSNHLPKGVRTYVPRSTKLLGYQKNGKYLTLNVSRDFYHYLKTHERELLSIISHTFKETLGVEYIRILVEGQPIRYADYEYVWMYYQDFVLNAMNHPSLERTQLVIYYFTPVEDTFYLVPVTYFVTESEDVRTLIDYYLMQPSSLPVLSFPDDQELIDRQYRLTLMANRLISEDDSYRRFNEYQIALY